MTKTNTQALTLRLSSEPRSIVKIEQFVKAISSRFCLDNDQHGNILISLTEAVNNAIIHGNCEDISKKVCVSLQEMKGKLAIQVSDEGCGFDPDQVADPTKEENLLRCGGRGVFLMKNLSDKLTFHNGGRTVEMQFVL